MRNPQFRRSVSRRLTYLHREFISRSIFFALAPFLTLALAQPASAIIDLEGDSLDDVWEQYYGFDSSTADVPGGNEHKDTDLDMDGDTNLEECIAGTDPNDFFSCHTVDDAGAGGGFFSLNFPTVDGKCYLVQSSDDGLVFTDEGNTFQGTGKNLTINLSGSEDTEAVGCATHDIYVNIGTGGIGDLASLTAAIAGGRDAVEAVAGIQVASNVDDEYGGRIRGFIKPAATGSYTFYLACQDAGRFSFDDNQGGGLTSRVTVPENSAVGPADFAAAQAAGYTYGPVTLTAGETYEFETLHSHGDDTDHCAVGWSGPGITGTEVVGSQFLCPIIDVAGAALAGELKKLIRVVVYDIDQDGDLISDYAEKLMRGDGSFSPFDANSTGGGSGSGETSDDNTAVDAALTATGESITVDSSGASAIAHEDARDSADFEDPVPAAVAADNGRVSFSRVGSLQELTVSFAEDHLTVGGSGAVPGGALLDIGKEPAQSADYTFVDSAGNPVGNTVTFPFGRTLVEVYVVPANAPGNIDGDGIAEYPETVLLTVNTDGGGAWTVPGGSDSAEITICDALDIPEQETLFVGAFEPEETALGAGVPIVTSGFATAVINGPRNKVTLHAEYDSLPGVEFEKHIHKSNPNTPGSNNGLIDKGAIIFDIYNTPFSQPSGDQIGNMGPYVWDLSHHEAGAAQRRKITIDSFFGQSGVTPPYLNVHDNVFPAGAAWAVFQLVSGSIDPPDAVALGYTDPGRPPFISHTTGAGALKLRREIWRFLDQATFGAKEAEVDQLYDDIVFKRENDGDPTYHRYERFLDWIDAQILQDQTYVLDLHLAMDFQEYTNRGFFEPSLWATENGNNLLMSGGFRQIQDPDGSLLGQLDLDNLTGGAARTGDESYIGAPFTYTVPTMPATPAAWPYMVRSDPAGDPEDWVPSGDFPMRRTHLEWYNDDVFRLPNQASPNPVNAAGVPITSGNGTYFPGGTNDGPEFGEPSFSNMRRALYTCAIDAKDQLRQKLGFAIQQINVISLEEGNDLDNYSYGTSNYQDMINAYCLPRDKDGDGVIERIAGDPDNDEGSYYRDVMGWVVWSPQMAFYLSNIRNEKAQYDDNGTPDRTDDILIASPDENLAREVMQLFTVGLFKMHLDGSLVLSAENGLPLATYNNDDIQELSRVLTGLNFSYYNNGGNTNAHLRWDLPAINESFTRTGGERYYAQQYWYRTKPFAIAHDSGADYITGVGDGFTIIGGKHIDNSGSGLDSEALGTKDIDDAIDWLSGVRDGTLVDHDANPATVSVPNDFEDDEANSDGSHGTTPPFIAYRLIQRFTTSTPSKAYRYRVAHALSHGFDANYDGDLDDANDIPNVDGGDLANAMRAVLLDPEVRDIDAVDDYSGGVGRVFGRKISPLEAEIKFIRSLRAKSLMPMVDPAGAAGTDPTYLSFYGWPASQWDNFETGTQHRFGNLTGSLGMSFMRQPTVFNWYTPFFSPGGIIANSSLTAPEMSLATDNGVVQNVNYFENILYGGTSTAIRGQGVDGIPQSFWAHSTSANFVDEDADRVRDTPPVPVDFIADATGAGGPGGQQYNIGNPNEGLADDLIIPSDVLAADLIPATGSSLQKSTGLVDALDLILCSGSLKKRYPYDHSDDATPIDHDDNSSTPLEAPGPNPREIIIDHVNATTNTTTKVRRALLLIGTSPDFLVRQ